MFWLVGMLFFICLVGAEGSARVLTGLSSCFSVIWTLFGKEGLFFAVVCVVVLHAVIFAGFYITREFSFSGFLGVTLVLRVAMLMFIRRESFLSLLIG